MNRSESTSDSLKSSRVFSIRDRSGLFGGGRRRVDMSLAWIVFPERESQLGDDVECIYALSAGGWLPVLFKSQSHISTEAKGLFGGIDPPPNH